MESLKRGASAFTPRGTVKKARANAPPLSPATRGLLAANAAQAKEIARMRKENEVNTAERERMRKLLPGAHAPGVHDRLAQANVLCGIIQRCGPKSNEVAKEIVRIAQIVDALNAPARGAGSAHTAGAGLFATVNELHVSLVAARSALMAQRRVLAAAAHLSARVVKGTADPRAYSAELDRTCVWTTENSPERRLAAITTRVAKIASRVTDLRGLCADVGAAGGSREQAECAARAAPAAANVADSSMDSDERSVAATLTPRRGGGGASVSAGASAGASVDAGVGASAGAAPRAASPVQFATPPRASHREDWAATPLYSIGPSGPSPYRSAVPPRCAARASPRPAPAPRCIPAAIWLDNILPLLAQCELIKSAAGVSSAFLAITNQLVRRFDVSEGPSRTTLPASIARSAARSVVATQLLAHAVRRFPKLDTISMRDTGITTCPAAILARATGVTSLDFSRNRGLELPDAIGGLKELEHLDLFGCGPRCDNASVGAMRQSSVMCPLLPPALFVRCTKLKSLVLGYNYGLVLTESIGLLHGSLQYLHIASCGLSALPNALFDCANLHSLHVSGNRLRTLTPSIGKLKQLRILGASHCGLADVPPQLFNGCAKLEVLNLGDNQMSTDFLSARFAKLAELKVLLLPGCDLEHVPVYTYKLAALEALDLGGNPIGVLSSSIAKLAALAQLSVSHCELVDLPDAMCECTSLTKIDASHNCFTEVPLCVVELEGLIHLNISANEISTLDAGLFELQRLEVLNVANNPIDEAGLLGADAFTSAVKLPDATRAAQLLAKLVPVANGAANHLPDGIGDGTVAGDDVVSPRANERRASSASFSAQCAAALADAAAREVDAYTTPTRRSRSPRAPRSDTPRLMTPVAPEPEGGRLITTSRSALDAAHAAAFPALQLLMLDGTHVASTMLDESSAIVPVLNAFLNGLEARGCVIRIGSTPSPVEC